MQNEQEKNEAGAVKSQAPQSEAKPSSDVKAENKSTKKAASTAKKTVTTKKSSKKTTKNDKADAVPFAVISSGGKQYLISDGSIINIEKIDGEAGSKVEFDSVLLYSDHTNVSVGAPYLDTVKVSGTILGQNKSKKEIVFKFKKKTGYQKKQGHRQLISDVRIDKITIKK
ncbi:MAG: 50S ribosomal protein L21 [Actinobacteria bacterium]|nr:50S ribosomal protein L21 [Actinomycetota bacterium]